MGFGFYFPKTAKRSLLGCTKKGRWVRRRGRLGSALALRYRKVRRRMVHNLSPFPLTKQLGFISLRGKKTFEIAQTIGLNLCIKIVLIAHYNNLACWLISEGLIASSKVR